MERINRYVIAAQTRLADEEGQAMTEYAVVLTLLVAGVVTAMGLLTGKMGDWIDHISTTISSNLP